MYKSICVIGLGTIGGFLSKDLSELENVETLILIDYDKVKKKNINNSIYEESDINLLKTKAIKNKLNSKIKVITINTKFIENQTYVPKCDLVIDCRDFVYDRSNLIDVRLYISSRSLVLDCRKNIKYDKNHEGRYLERLSKIDLKNASFHVSLLINNEIIKKLIDNQVVQEFELDSISKNIQNLITNSEKNKEDIVYDYNSNEKRIINFLDNSSKIIQINKNNNIVFYVGGENLPYNSKVIEKNNLKTINDINSSIESLINTLPFQFNYYIISIKNNNNKFYVQLLPETGAA